MLFGHTSSLMSLTKAMGIQLEKTPGWAAALLFELYESISEDNSYYVRTIFKNSTYVEDFYTLEVPGCGTVCSLERFIEALAPMAVPNYKAECATKSSEMGNSYTTGIMGDRGKKAKNNRYSAEHTCDKKKGKKC